MGEIKHKNNTFYTGEFKFKWFNDYGIKPKIILDVGSYDFGDSIKYKKAYPESSVYSFEADPNRYNLTHKFAEELGIKTFNKAVYSNNGNIGFYQTISHKKNSGDFHKSGDIGGQGSIHKINNKYKQRFPHVKQMNEPITVECIKISSFCEQMGISEISLLHIDVEGAEKDVINGLGDIRPKLIYVEMQDNLFTNSLTNEEIKKEDTHLLLVNMGYKLKVDGIDRLYVYN